MYTQLNLLSSATGILVTGCPSSRRKRALEGRGGEACGTSDSSEPTLSGSNLDSMCATDTTEDTGLANALARAVKTANTVKATDSATFSAAGSNYLITATFGIIGPMLCVIFNRA